MDFTAQTCRDSELRNRNTERSDRRSPTPSGDAVPTDAVRPTLFCQAARAGLPARAPALSTPHPPGLLRQQIPMKRVAVFCGASTGNDPAFLAAATELGRKLAERGIGIVYVGGSVGVRVLPGEAIVLLLGWLFAFKLAPPDLILSNVGVASS